VRSISHAISSSLVYWKLHSASGKWHDGRKIKQKASKTYNSGDSLVVTHLTTNPPVSCLYMAERTGSLILKILWSYVKDWVDQKNYNHRLCEAEECRSMSTRGSVPIGHLMPQGYTSPTQATISKYTFSPTLSALMCPSLSMSTYYLLIVSSCVPATMQPVWS
jgi:hypothetical protein